MPDEEDIDPVRQWEEEVSQLYDFALTDAGKKQGGLLAVSDSVAARFLAEAGVDVSGFFHVLDADGIRHIHKKHGGSGEYLRGQIPIVKQDFLHLRLVMADPDTISQSAKSHQGLIAVEITKEVQGHTLYYVEVVRTGRWRLAPVSFYKRRSN